MTGKRVEVCCPYGLAVAFGLMSVVGWQYRDEAQVPKVRFDVRLHDVNTAFFTTASGDHSLRFAVASMVGAEQTFATY